MRKIKNRATLLFLIIIIAYNTIALTVSLGFRNQENSLFDQNSSLIFDNAMSFSNQQDILAQIESQTSTNGVSPKTSSLNDDLYPNWWIEAINA